jgi:hypothetical protein
MRAGRRATGASSENSKVIKRGLEVVAAAEFVPQVIKFAVIHFYMDAAPSADEMMMADLRDPLVRCGYVVQDGSRDQTKFPQRFQSAVYADQADAGVDRQHVMMNLLRREMSLESLGDVYEEKTLWGDP